MKIGVRIRQIRQHRHMTQRELGEKIGLGKNGANRIIFNYKEGTTTITFDDLKTALANQKTGSDLDCSTAPETALHSV